MRAQAVLRKRAEVEGRIARIEKLGTDITEASDFFELCAAENDEATLAEAAREVTKLEARMREAELERMLSGPADHSNAIVSLSAGEGGTESRDWTEMLLRMYLRWCERRGFKAEIIDSQPGDDAGLSSASFTVTGENAYGFLRSETGVHRLVRISPFDSNARRHTSFTSVFVFPEVDDSIEIAINPADVRTDTYRASGAGGQHINKTDSAVRLTHVPTGIVVQCQNDRSQHRNRDEAWQMLRARLYEFELRKQQAEQHGNDAAETEPEFAFDFFTQTDRAPDFK